ncbi:MAG: hypothetical protein WC306_02485 [Candidatus Paceibacterota bacterium]
MEILIMIEAASQVKEELITRTPGTRKLAVFKIIKLMTKAKIPNVSQMRGKKIKRIIGFIKRLRKVKTKAKKIN